MSPAYDATPPVARDQHDLSAVPQAVLELALPQEELGHGLTLEAGETLYHRGDVASSSFLVTSGLLALSLDGHAGRERLVDLAGPGDVVGALNSAQERYLDTAAALGPDVRVIAMPEDVAVAAHAGEMLKRAAAARLERLTEQLQDVDVPVAARVARAFVRLAERFGQDSADGMIRLTLPLTHDTLAGLVGAARETTSAAVQGLRQLGLIAGTRGRYLVLPQALRDFADEQAAN